MTYSEHSLSLSAQQFAQLLRAAYPESQIRQTLQTQGTTEVYRAKQELYEHDPVGFVRDVIRFDPGDKPATYQLNALRELDESSRVAVRGPRGLGKSALAAWAVLWWAYVWDGRTDWKVITTAGVWRQLTEFLWPEIRKWGRRVNPQAIGRGALLEGRELMMQSIRMGTGGASAIASNRPELMEGAHATQLLYIFDESKSIDAGVWDSVEGAFSSGLQGKWLALSTPGEASGAFYDIMAGRRASWQRVKVDIEDAIEAGRISRDWVESRKLEWGEDDPRYQEQVLGEFSSGAKTGLIPLGWIEASNEAWLAWDKGGRVREDGTPSVITHIGVDVGGGTGGDASVVAVVYDGHIVGDLISTGIAEDPSIATMQLAANVLGIWSLVKQSLLSVDSIGIGAGVLHWLRTQGCPAIAFVAGASTDMREESGIYGYANWRAAGWYGLSYLLSPISRPRLWIPPNDKLSSQLLAMQTRGANLRLQYMVSDKEEVRKKIRMSTDEADAIMHAIMGPLLQAAQGQTSTVVTRLRYDVGY